MINITSETMMPIEVIDNIFRSNINNAIGVTTGGYGTILHLPDVATAQQQATTQAILIGYDTLTISADKITMVEGDVDPVITVSSSDATLGYVVLLDDEIYDSGEVVPSEGTATLNLVSPVDGIYQIFVYRKTDDYTSGSVTITVSEV